VAGEAIVIHCRGGLGRTGIVAARLLVEFGEDPEGPPFWGAPCADGNGREPASGGVRAGSAGGAGHILNSDDGWVWECIPAEPRLVITVPYSRPLG